MNCPNGNLCNLPKPKRVAVSSHFHCYVGFCMLSCANYVPKLNPKKGSHIDRVCDSMRK